MVCFGKYVVTVSVGRRPAVAFTGKGVSMIPRAGGSNDVFPLNPICSSVPGKVATPRSETDDWVVKKLYWPISDGRNPGRSDPPESVNDCICSDTAIS